MPFPLPTIGSHIMVTNQDVEDFHFIKKDVIFTVACSAIQELDRENAALKEQVTVLQTQYSALLARIEALETM
jgi:FtsZ-binding cell division protein ZapB